MTDEQDKRIAEIACWAANWTHKGCPLDEAKSVVESSIRAALADHVLAPYAGRADAWIPVSERLPAESTLEKKNIVLAWFDYGNILENRDFGGIHFAEISCGHWRPINGNGNFDKYVTYWQPPPPPPARGADET